MGFAALLAANVDDLPAEHALPTALAHEPARGAQEQGQEAVCVAPGGHRGCLRYVPHEPCGVRLDVRPAARVLLWRLARAYDYEERARAGTLS